MLLLMAVPGIVALVFLLLAPRQQVLGHRWRGGWLLAVAALAQVLSDRLRATGLDDVAINRATALTMLGLLAAVTWLNLPALQRLAPRLALLGVVVGGSMNAVVTLVYGYMPVLKEATVVAGYSPFAGLHPDPRYVYSDGLGWPGILLGDLLPIPGGLKVLSLGDLLLLPGLAVALVLFLLSFRTFGSDVPAIAEGGEPG
jgi:hypothetical protein